jgi:hypothetical protein
LAFGKTKQKLTPQAGARALHHYLNSRQILKTKATQNRNRDIADIARHRVIGSSGNQKLKALSVNQYL